MENFWLAFSMSIVIWIAIASKIALNQIRDALDYAEQIPDNMARIEFLDAASPFLWAFKTLVFLNPIKDLPEWSQAGYIEWRKGIRPSDLTP